MKTLSKVLFFIIMFTIYSAIVQADEVGNGGDPKPIESLEFPNPELLNGAIEHLKECVEQSRLMEIFKKEFLAELNQLKDENKFRYIEGIIVELPNNERGGYTRLVSLGAKTTMKPGSEIYFTKQVLSYSKTELARVIAQEIPHHVLYAIGSDENFVNYLGEILISSTYDENVNDVIRLSYLTRHYLKDGELLNEYKWVKQAIAALINMPIEEVRASMEIDCRNDLLIGWIHKYYKKQGWILFPKVRAIVLVNTSRYDYGAIVHGVANAIRDSRYSEKDLSDIFSSNRWWKGMEKNEDNK